MFKLLVFLQWHWFHLLYNYYNTDFSSLGVSTGKDDTLIPNLYQISPSQVPFWDPTSTLGIAWGLYLSDGVHWNSSSSTIFIHSSIHSFLYSFIHIFIHWWFQGLSWGDISHTPLIIIISYSKYNFNSSSLISNPNQMITPKPILY